MARLFAEKKAKIVAISDSRGGVHNPRGIDPLRALRYKERAGTVVGMPGASRISNDELLAMKCDILVPASSSKIVITLHNADQDQGENSGRSRQRSRPRRTPMKFCRAKRLCS